MTSTDQDMEHLHDKGLAFDLDTMIDRRRALKLMGIAGLLALAGCASGGSSNDSTATTAAGSTSTEGMAGECATLPTETAGPYPGDGSNGPNVLIEDGIVRSDIRSSFGGASATATGVRLEIEIRMQDIDANCSALVGAAVYLWHCDSQGRYSLYSRGVTSENYLRGVQASGEDGLLRFQSIFPAAYSGRWPHIHFEVYRDLDAAMSGATPLLTSQIALPEDVCDAVYATDGYPNSVTNMARTSLDSDMVFRDGYSQQMATATGSVDAGYKASIAIPV